MLIIFQDVVVRWNQSKGRVDEITFYLGCMIFSFTNGTHKKTIGDEEIKKVVVNVRSILKHCFATKPAPIGKGYAAIQCHQRHLRISMRDFIFKLAISYKLMHDVWGKVTGSPILKTVTIEEINAGIY